MTLTPGQRLKIWLVERRLRQGWLAEQIGVTDTTVSLWISGAKLPNLLHAAAIERIAGIAARDWVER